MVEATAAGAASPMPCQYATESQRGSVAVHGHSVRHRRDHDHEQRQDLVPLLRYAVAIPDDDVHA